MKKVIKTTGELVTYKHTTINGWYCVEKADGTQIKLRASQLEDAPANIEELLDNEGLTGMDTDDVPAEIGLDPATLGTVRIRHVGESTYNPDHYHKTKSANNNASLDNGDMTAIVLRGLDIDAVYAVVAEGTGKSVDELKARYNHLNIGMQRMNLGNILRSTAKKSAQEKAA